MDREPSILEKRNAHLDTSSLCIYFLATPWGCSSNVVRNKTKAWHDEWIKCSNKLKQRLLGSQRSKDSRAQAVPTQSKAKALEEIMRFKCSAPAEGWKVQNNPPLCKSHTKRCSNCSVAVGTSTLMQVKQRKILQGRCKQSCRWGHGSNFSLHADHMASRLFHWNGIENNWIAWCNRMKWNWIEQKEKLTGAMERSWIKNTREWN